jgi:hypothetical protein
MGIRKKNKRKLIHKNEAFYWWVLEECDELTGDSLLVSIASEDKNS